MSPSTPRRSFARPSLLAAGALALAALASPLALAEKAARTEKGATLVVPADQASKGTVYYVMKGKDGQVTFTSDAPLEHIKGTSSQVIGYAVVSKDGTPALLAGQFHLPVASLDTGIKMRNEHLQSEGWLNAAANPDIVFNLKSSRDTKLAKETPDAKSYDLTLVGDMTVNGVTKPMDIPARVTFLPASEKTKSRAPGDLMGLRCQYTIKLADFGVSSPVVGAKVAEEVEIDTALFFTTVNPETMAR
jgi:polyisoprenoid-binding protein YceI